MRGIVLAAGAGRRMGAPKVLLEIEGQSLVRLHADRLFEIGCDEVIVVAPLGVPVQAQALAPRFTVICAHTASQAESLSLAVRSPGHWELAVITPVDVLPASKQTFRALLRALTAPMVAATPQFEGHGGHPVVIRKTGLASYFASLALPLRACLEQLGSRRARVSVPDASVAFDFDTPADFAGSLAAANVRAGGLTGERRR